ncbi:MULTISPECIES: anti-repressor SinI family protein [Paenibacillus]|jgi:DNA-binding transcriptional MerR regulator|uniref:Anti-repressor SinI family protein n=1 Tax=Paenibacillus oceani TaxID=2772510 RepID=A0A927H0P6_9BACL|nr:anti-repressor SinI family protein [Paenibacillus oceani]MBD2864301.1 anti-repressor SinI family protein [Paenibacillus oceani]MDF2660738.1 Anti-repressor SinI [Paenibacillus sp.]
MQGFRQLEQHEHDTRLDPNWIHLMIAAKEIGISIEEVRQFLQECTPGGDEPD